MDKVFPLHAMLNKNQHHKFAGKGGYVCFEKKMGCFVVSGDPVVKDGYLVQDLMKEFLSYANNQKKSVCGYYFSKEFSIKNQLEFHKAGYSSLVDLQNFNLHGHARRDLRRAVVHGDKLGLKVKEITHSQKSKYLDDILELEKGWLKSKKLPQIKFLLSSPKLGFKNDDQERWFIVYKNKSLHAFVSMLPYKGGEAYYLDHMIKSPSGNNFALDYLLVNVFRKFKKQNVQEISLGFNAFQGVIPKTFFELSFWAMGHLKWPYNSKGIYHFKRKYSDLELPRYVMLDPRASRVKQVAALTSVTFPQIGVQTLSKFVFSKSPIKFLPTNSEN